MNQFINGWDKNYLNGRFNRYPYDRVVSFILNNFSSGNRSTKRILDLGCGGGNHIKFLAEEGFNYYGIDGSEESIRLSNLILNTIDNPKLKVSNFIELDYSDYFFDAIIDRQSMGHNKKEDIKLILSEIRRILKKGGKLHSHVFGKNDRGFSFGIGNIHNDYTDYKKSWWSEGNYMFG